MIFYLGNVIEDNQRFPTYLFGRESWELFHKTFFYIIYNKIALNYGIFEMMIKFMVKIWL